MGHDVVVLARHRAPPAWDTYKTNKPSEQLFVVPAALTAGTYRLEVRSKNQGSSVLRTAALAAALTVA